MFRLFTVSRLAAAVFAAAILVQAAACGSDNAKSSPSPAGTGDSPGASARPGGIAGQTIDLANTSPLLTLASAGNQELATGTGSVALGDFNGDGKKDALIGAPQADGPDGSRTDSGAAYIIFGPLDGKKDLGKDDADVAIFGASPGDGLGFTVLAGDLNDDGVDDVLVGAPGVTAGFDPRSDQGRVYVFYGGKDLGKKKVLDLTEDVYDFTVTGAEGFSRLGSAMALGDVNDDGKNDLVIGAPFAGRKAGTPPGGERTSLGEVYVVFGSDKLSGELNIAKAGQDVLLSGGEAFGQFGGAVAIADVNGDGKNDIVVSAQRAAADASREASGVVYVFYGKRDLKGRISVQDGAQDATILGPKPSASFGFPLAAGDFNGDGTADIAAGAQAEGSGDHLTAGSVRIVFGGESLKGTVDLAQTAAGVTIPGPAAGELLPSALAAADLNGDGVSDLAMGAMLASAAAERTGSGVVYVVPGKRDLPSSIDLAPGGEGILTVLGAKHDDRLGNSLAVGKLSGDKQGLLIVAPGVEGGGNGARPGAVYGITLELP